jgi:DNA mismatch repair protein MutL
MPIIKRLPEQLINQIAAGEVVERPASAVKELVENSMDAGATRIIVEITGSGQPRICVTDDGCGMDREDALMIFERHATSKIYSSDDLFNIRSLGFRGEAVASIASVSKISVHTRKKGEVEGTDVYFEGGKMIDSKPAGTPEGTRIEITELFYNTPARSKYMKNDATEYRHVLNTLTGLALAHFQTAFRFIHDGKTVFDLPPAKDAFTRINSMMGKEVSGNLAPVFYGHSKIQIEGFVGKPEIARANRNNQYLFVNGREIKSPTLAFAVKQSFYSLLPKEKYPVFFIYLNIDPEMVDVNVHPRKTEVRFSDERDIFRAVMQSCDKALQNSVLAPRIGVGNENNYDMRPHQQLLRLADAVAGAGVSESGHAPAEGAQVGAAAYEPSDASVHVPSGAQAHTGTFRQPALMNNGFINNRENASVEEALNFTKEFAEGSREMPERIASRDEEAEIIALTQIGNSYILCQKGEALVIVDQHAAHERIRYTEICEQFEKRIKPVQPLLMPLQMELSHKDVQVLNDNRELLAEMGFEIENFGGNTFSVLSVPSYVVKEDLQKVIAGLVDDMNDQAVKGDYQKRKERALVYMACRSAVKFGDRLSAEEQQGLVKKLQTLALPYTCPHGRPTMITMSFQELEKRFGRRGF